MNPLQKYPGHRAILPPAYFGSVERYALMAACGAVTVDVNRKFDKRLKSTHRCVIADTRGPLTLTVPIEKPRSFRNARWSDIVVSGHDDWPRLHVTALESAYGRTPFFEFYIDRFAPVIISAVGRKLVEVDAELEALVMRALGLSALTNPDLPELSLSFTAEPYWQVRADKLGFIPGLSILDLLFNLGPEAPLYLKRIVNAAEISR